MAKSQENGEKYPVFILDKDIKVRGTEMATRRLIHTFRGGDIKEIKEFHDGRYGAPGEKRQKKKKPTKEQMAIVNALNKAETARHRLLEYFGKSDYFLTLTYKVEERPSDMGQAKKDFTKLIDRLRRRYRKEQIELRWIRNIEKGTKGAWHIHLILTGCRDTICWAEECWDHGGIYAEKLGKSKFYEEDFSQLASYITKSEKVGEKREDGSRDKPRLSESSYSTSKNMPLKPPRRKKLVRWPKEIRPEKGYYVAKSYEGINPATGYKYRRYTLIRINRRI